MQFPILLLTPRARLVVATLLVVSRGTLVLLALYHLPLLVPALYHTFELPPLTPRQLQRVLAAFFLLPEVTAWIVCRLSAATARIESGTLLVERRGRRREVPRSNLGGATPWLLPLPRPGVRFQLRPGALLPGVAAADLTPLLSALAEAGACRQVALALQHPSIRHANARQRVRGLLDHPLLKFVLFAFLLAVPLFRLHQWVAYGGTFGEYYQFGLKAYLLGFGIYWLLSAIHLLLLASGLRAISETITLTAAWTLRGWELAVRRIVEILHRVVYYLGPPTLMFVRLVLQ